MTLGSFLLIAALLIPTTSPGSETSRITVKTQVAGKWIEGLPLRRSQAEIHLLGRDGHLHTISADKAKDYSKVADGFTGFTAAELRGKLLREFGSRFDVSGTGHYLVVHPAGQRDYWANRFEELYRSFVHYFRVRGLQVRALEFPLVAIVVQTEEELHAYAAKEGTRVPRGVLGYYSPISNRVILFDQGGGKASQEDWADNSDTIIHEAAHQSAFNTGLHSRYAMPPRWVVEGLGTMFEAPGVWNCHEFRQRSDRINAGRLAEFKRLVAGRINGPLLRNFIASDAAFGADMSFSYATSWALTFYLVETRPAKYCQYLTATANRAAFSEYPPQKRLADYEAQFGSNYAMEASRLLRFIADLETLNLSTTPAAESPTRKPGERGKTPGRSR
jgi:hypothetical protein